MIKLANDFVGVDISKFKLDIYIYPSGKSFKIKNTKQDIGKFIQELSKYNIEQIGCEASGGYEKSIIKSLKKASYKTRIEDPRKIKSFISSQGIKYKNDKIDAKKIAEFIAQNNSTNAPIEKTESQLKLQDIVNRKNDLLQVVASEKTRLKSPSHEGSLSNIKKHIKFLEKEINKLDKEIQEIVNDDKELINKAKILDSVPGVGPATISTLLSFVPELGKLNSKEISALLGVCPYDNESGQYKGKRFIRGGRPTPRKILYMSALTAIKYNPKLKKFFDRLIEAGKCFKVAIVAVMHKLIIILNAMLKKGEVWNPNI